MNSNTKSPCSGLQCPTTLVALRGSVVKYLFAFIPKEGNHSLGSHILGLVLFFYSSYIFNKGIDENYIFPKKALEWLWDAC